MGLSSRVLGKYKWSSPVVFVLASIALLILATVYFGVYTNVFAPAINETVRSNGINCSIPIISLVQNTTNRPVDAIYLSQPFSWGAVGFYMLIVTALTALTFRHFKLDLALFSIRLIARTAMLFCVLDLAILILCPEPFYYLPFLLVIGLIASYFVIQGSKFRIRLRVRQGTSIKHLGQEERLQLPVDGVIELLVTGVSMKDFKVGIEEIGGELREQSLGASYVENQWEVSTIPLGSLPCTVTVLHDKDKIQAFKVERKDITFINRLIVDIVVRNIPVLRDAELSLRISVDRPLREVVNLIREKFEAYFVDADTKRVRVFLGNRLLGLDLSLYENGLADDSKIEAHVG
jgi:uncharacterized ubiquitin-like protein YukD